MIDIMDYLPCLTPLATHTYYKSLGSVASATPDQSLQWKCRKNNMWSCIRQVLINLPLYAIRVWFIWTCSFHDKFLLEFTTNLITDIPLNMLCVML